MSIFEEGGKAENPEKNPRNRDENQQQTQPTYDAGSGNQTRDTLVGGERSHHCAIPAPLVCIIFLVLKGSSKKMFLLACLYVKNVE